jgi:Domain of unknown function (DUF5979)/Thioester domain
VLRTLTRPWIAVTAALTATALALLVLLPPAASGRLIGSKPPGVTARSGSNTQMTLTSTGAGHSVDGFIANSDNPYDSATQPYPTTNPIVGFTPQNESFAGIINGTPTGGGSNLELYCIDIRTNTYIGFGYQLGTWDSANVPNVGFVARILTEFYPNTNQPSSLTSAADKAAAVQAAIWYFSDRYVLSTSDPLHAAVAAIVAQVQAEGPLVQPPPPSLAITPTDASGPAGSAVGPFTVTSSLADATVTAIGANMFANAAATIPIANGASVPSGTQIWLKSTGPASAILQATANATVPSGNVYLYDGNSTPTEAQKLILAQTTTLTTTVTATAEFKPPGSLVVNKTIAGPAAGLQGRVVIDTVCDQTPLTPDLVIPGGSPADTYSRTYTGIPAGSQCTVTETADGHTSMVTVAVTGSGQTVTVPAGGTATASLTDTYDHAPGSLEIDKLIDGPAAGQQGQVTIHTVCNGAALSPDFVIPAGSPAHSYSQTYTDIPAGSSCTVTETADGSSTTVTATVTGSGQTVTVPAGGTATASLTDTYDFAPGSLVVEKTIAGPAAGLQDEIVIHTVCNGTALAPDFVIPAGTPAGTSSMTYTDIPAGSLCTVTETADGHTGPVTVVMSGKGTQVTVPAGGTATASLTNTYLTAPGTLVVNKIIGGTAAGQQGDITIEPVCNGTALAPFTIPAGSAPGAYSMTYSITTPASCTVTETGDGSTSAVTVAVTGSGQTVTVPAGDAGTADLTDTYHFAPGSLTVDKTITGPAAGRQGQVTIHTVCDGTALTPDLVIPADSPAGPYSQTYSGIPGNSMCTVTETADGHTSTVNVTVMGDGEIATVPPGGSVTASLTDTYDFVPGALVVSKSVDGHAAGHQGEVSIAVSCTLNGAQSFSGQFVIPAGSPAGTSMHEFDDIPAGSTCTTTETQDGHTSTVTATVTGSPQTTAVGAGDVVPVAILDSYDYAPGSLTVTKSIRGPAAGNQGRIAILVGCKEPAQVFAFIIPAGTPAGSIKRSFNGIAAGSRCIVAEVVNGASSAVSVVVGGNGQKVTVPAGGTANARLTDRFSTIVPVTG